PKTGKTLLVGRLAEKYNLLWFDLEQGSSTLLQLPKEQQERIELIRIPDTKDNPVAIKTLLKVFTGLRVRICWEHGRINCSSCKTRPAEVDTVFLRELPEDTIVVVDSLSQLADSAMSHITEDYDEDEKAKPSWDNYSHQALLMSTILSSVQQASYNCVF